MAKKKTKLSDQLREAILNADISRYRISQLTGISEAALSRFVNKVNGLSLESIDLIAECIGLRLVVEEKPGRKTRKRKTKGN
jgi:transcriptional regulator with XRE-family HTH domain